MFRRVSYCRSEFENSRLGDLLAPTRKDGNSEQNMKNPTTDVCNLFRLIQILQFSDIWPFSALVQFRWWWWKAIESPVACSFIQRKWIDISTMQYFRLNGIQLCTSVAISLWLLSRMMLLMMLLLMRIEEWNGAHRRVSSLLKLIKRKISVVEMDNTQARVGGMRLTLYSLASHLYPMEWLHKSGMQL